MIFAIIINSYYNLFNEFLNNLHMFELKDFNYEFIENLGQKEA